MMPVDPYEVMLDAASSDEDVNDVEPVNNKDGVESTPEWNLMREELSISISRTINGDEHRDDTSHRRPREKDFNYFRIFTV
ncbi:hypothetical protein ACS0TY_023022 [Phlomoides rotata]